MCVSALPNISFGVGITYSSVSASGVHLCPELTEASGRSWPTHPVDRPRVEQLLRRIDTQGAGTALHGLRARVADLRGASTGIDG